MSHIKVMDSSLSNMIAAGEVVERPANVVKELVENAVDAHATEIEIKIKDAGRTLIRVKDNGDGMNSEDASLAFLRHATSKISTKRDLFAIHTLGFRGEALPSIAAVSRVLLETSQGGVGTRIVVENDKVISKENSQARQGTIVEVTKLFYTTPARLKFLKSDGTEYANIVDVVSKEALANPKVSFTLLNDKEDVVLRTSGRDNPLEVIKDVYGLEAAQNVLPVNLMNHDYQITGYIGKFILSKSNRNYLIFIVNGRVVRIPLLQSMVCDAYANYLPHGRYPFVVLYLKTDPSLIDVNVHPSKSEIRIEYNDKLAELIKDGIRNTLQQSFMVPNAADTQVEAKLNPQPTLDNDLKFVLKEPTPDFEMPVAPVQENQVTPTANKTKQTVMMTPIGQIHGTYIVAESPDGFYLIDQHAAMERINFEKFSKSLMEDKTQTDLLVPCVVEFSLNVINIIKDKLALLDGVGIKAEFFGNNALKVSSIPTWMKDIDLSSYVQDMVEQIVNKQNVNVFELRSYAIATVACKASLKANSHLSLEEMNFLIQRLLACENPHTCPHGRPTMLFYSTYDIEKMFKRVG